jgi:hypothetical protein
MMVEPPAQGDTRIIVSLAQAAMQVHMSAIDALPAPEDPRFHDRAEVILSGLHKLQTALTDAARTDRSTLSVIVLLGEVRSRYNDLMAVAAGAPGATLGQQLYVASTRAHLSADEIAVSAGLRKDLLDGLEAGETPTKDEARKIKDVIAALGNSSNFGWAESASRPVPTIDAANDTEGWDEEPIAEPVGG